MVGAVPLQQDIRVDHDRQPRGSPHTATEALQVGHGLVQLLCLCAKIVIDQRRQVVARRHRADVAMPRILKEGPSVRTVQEAPQLGFGRRGPADVVITLVHRVMTRIRPNRCRCVSGDLLHLSDRPVSPHSRCKPNVHRPQDKSRTRRAHTRRIADINPDPHYIYPGIDTRRAPEPLDCDSWFR